MWRHAYEGPHTLCATKPGDVLVLARLADHEGVQGAVRIGFDIQVNDGESSVLW